MLTTALLLNIHLNINALACNDKPSQIGGGYSYSCAVSDGIIYLRIDGSHSSIT